MGRCRDVDGELWGPVAPACLDVASDADLAARLLEPGPDRQRRAQELLRRVGGWWGLRRGLEVSKPAHALSQVEIRRLSAALEIGRRGLVERVGRAPLLTPEAVVGRYRDLALEEVEVLIGVGLDPGRRPVHEHRLRGSVDGVQVHPRDLLRPLIAAGATAMIVLHNHPSGSPRPSEADLTFTRRLQEAAGVCGIPLLDHLIIAGGGWRSLAGLLNLAEVA